jgi:hypothetical protein
MDLLDRPSGPLGGLLGGSPSPDQSLDVAGTHSAFDLGPRLSQARPIVPNRGPQRLVDGHPESRALGSTEQEVLTVLMYADKLQVLHRHLLSRPTTTDSAISDHRPGGCHAATVVLGDNQ